MTRYNLWVTVRYGMDTAEGTVISERIEAVEEALRDAVLEPDAGPVTFELEEADE